MRIDCPVHGLSRGARAHRRRMADHAAASHVAWSAALLNDTGLSRRVSMSAWEPVYRDLTGQGDMGLSHMQVRLYREDGTTEVLGPDEDASPQAGAVRLRELRNR